MKYFYFAGRLYYELIGKKIIKDNFKIQIGIIHSSSKKNLGKLAVIEDNEGGITLGTISKDIKDVMEFVHKQEHQLLIGFHRFVEELSRADGTFGSLCKQYNLKDGVSINY